MPLRRYIFNTLTVVSVVLVLGTVGLWVDSLSITTTIEYGSNNTSYMFIQENGRILIGSGKPITFGWKIQRINPATLGPGAMNVFDMGNGGIPHFLICIIFAILPAIWLFKWNKRRKLGPNACPSCGYDLTGNESGVCPECGVEST